MRVIEGLSRSVERVGVCAPALFVLGCGWDKWTRFWCGVFEQLDFWVIKKMAGSEGVQKKYRKLAQQNGEKGKLLKSCPFAVLKNFFLTPESYYSFLVFRTGGQEDSKSKGDSINGVM